MATSLGNTLYCPKDGHCSISYSHVQQNRDSQTEHLPCSSCDILGNVDMSRGLTGIFSSLDASLFSTDSVQDKGGKVDLLIGGSEPPPIELPKL